MTEGASIHSKTDDIVIACQSALDQLLANDQSVLLAAVATPDGFDIAQRARHGAASVSRLAAITSALSSLCAVAAKELSLGNQENLVIEADQGRMLLIHISFDSKIFILSVVASKEALLGKVLLSTRESARHFCKSVGAITRHPSIS